MKSPPRSILLRATGLLALDGAFFGLTDPMNVASWLLIIGFLLLMLTLYAGLRGAFLLAGFYGLSLHRRHHHLAAGLTGVIGALLALQAMGQLSSRDVLVLLPLVLVGYLYSTYSRSLSVERQ